MKDFKDYFRDESIILYLCRVRAKHAKQRNKKHLLHLLTNDEEFNYHTDDIEKLSEYEKKFQSDLNDLFPSRRKWKNIGEESRYKKKVIKEANSAADNKKQKISTIDKNIYSLLKTIRYYRKKKPNEDFVLKLNAFIKDIQASIENVQYEIIDPIVYPKPKVKKKLHELKDNEKNTCRPITLFSLKDRIILSFTNKYLTELFDPYFHDCSLAFRSVKKIDGNKKIISHHNAIQEIILYKKNHIDTPLWVAECDMKKFYDSVNHKIIIKQFEEFITKVNCKNPEIDTTISKRLFYKYLDCYAFNINVLHLNDNSDYWNKYKIPKGEFGWVNKDFKALNYYENIEEEKIGIPQGGALSGLIANLVLHDVDIKIQEEGLFYVRFCDDMILMHPDKEKCIERINVYQQSLQDIFLVPHEFCKDDKMQIKRKSKSKYLPDLSYSPFWKEKSKGSYLWGNSNCGGYPWIGFVGYEVNFSGHIRVRKSSLIKEKEKQIKIIDQISKAIEKQRRVSVLSIAESAIHRLIGMSVGRVEIWNYKYIENEMCWANGFQELNMNKYSVKQLKELDRTRSKLYYKLVNDLSKLVNTDIEEQKIKPNPKPKPKPRATINYHKPFSYYFQVAEKKMV